MDLRTVATRRPTAVAEGGSENLGRRLRALRTERGITLAQLGGLVGLSASYLSQIERNKTQPSLTTLSSIADTLGVELRSFFEHAAPVWQVVRQGQGEEFDDPGADARYELLSSGEIRGKFEPYRVTCLPSMRAEKHTHPGEEFLFILRGRLGVTVGDEAMVLGTGDSIHYQGSQPHAWRNESGQECQLVWAISPPYLHSGRKAEGAGG
jgi:transcriptional regulator with XRE-family HTH domain